MRWYVGASLMKKIGKYEVIKELGKGATSVVYLARDPFANREVAIKLVQPEMLENKEYGKRFRKLFLAEASLAGKLSHPHIAAIYDAVADDDDSYIVMEYVNGGTLEEHTRVDNLLPINKVVEVIFKSCKALDHAHRHGVIHRDIKPANILMAGGTDIKISDFGAALYAAAETTQVSGVGSPAYMSPEQCQDKPLTVQTDIFSLGVVMYQLLTGSLPFKANNNYSVVFQIINIDPPLPSVFRPEIPSSVDLIVRRALYKPLEKRYQNWEELSQDLVKCFSEIGRPGRALPDTEKFASVRGLSFFKNFSDADLWQALNVATWNRVEPQTQIVCEGDAGTSFYVLIAGEVKVTRGGKLLNVLRAGECFGEMAWLSRKQSKRSASVVSISEASVIEIRPEALASAQESCRHQFTDSFLEILVDRLDAADTRIAQLLKERSAVTT